MRFHHSRTILSFAFCVIALGVRADSANLKETAVGDWLVSGPWPSYVGEKGDAGLDTDFLDAEADVAPSAGDRLCSKFVADLSRLVAGVGSANEWGFRTTKTFDASWRKISAKDGIVTLDGVFAPIDDHFVAYAACYLEVVADVDAKLHVGSDDDHRLWLDMAEVGRQATSQSVEPGQFIYNVRLSSGIHRLLLKVADRTGGCGFCLSVTDRENRKIPGMKVLLDVRARPLALDAQRAAARSPEKLKPANAALEREIAGLSARLPELRKRLDAAKKAERSARRQLEKAYAQVESDYACQRKQAAAKGARSVDEPLERLPAPVRRRLCINGEWELSGDGGKTWETRCVPIRLCDIYFATWHLPVAHTTSHPYGPVTNLSGFADFNVSQNLFRKRVLLRTHFDWDGHGRAEFVSEGLVGAAELFCNGVSCGTCDSRVGIVTIPLKGCARGRNELVVDYSWSKYQRVREYNEQGLLGDVFIDYVGDVRVTDAFARPSWRKASLTAEIELANDTAEPVSAEIRTYAVRDGRVRLRLPSVAATLTAGRRTSVRSTSGWADPLVWGIGGKYGDPDLYDLVTDVVVAGRTVDRHVQRFGFREFWIHHTDFFLNGRRILLQGDVGQPDIGEGRQRDVFWPLLRADGINTVRFHDGDYWSVDATRGADRMGMLAYVQSYPNVVEPEKEVSAPFESWSNTVTHAFNLAHYKAWYRAYRNSPSVVIWSTDNEIFTQAWDTTAKWEANYRNDRIAALYEKYVKSLDPSLVLTRDGDVGTWGASDRWYESPPCDTANYHYPDYNAETWVYDWQRTYGWRPAVFGETLYCAYTVFDNWVGALPDRVAARAKRVRHYASLYRELGIPGQIYMGLAGDGFIIRDDSGRGNPQGITESEYRLWQKTGKRPHGQAVDQFPWFRIPWPALSGLGLRPIARRVCGNGWWWGHDAINVYDSRYPSHIRNAVNDAYRDSLIPQPPLRVGSDAEAMVLVEPETDVWADSPDGTRRIGVRADSRGRAWFRSLDPGRWSFSDGRQTAEADLVSRGPDVVRPGFPEMRTVRLDDGMKGGDVK